MWCANKPIQKQSPYSSYFQCGRTKLYDRLATQFSLQNSKKSSLPTFFMAYCNELHAIYKKFNFVKKHKKKGYTVGMPQRISAAAWLLTLHNT